MRFIDEARIEVAGGHGGPGSISFRRETFAPRGGPDGGDGGDGGDVIFVASLQLGTLQDFRFKKKYQAPAGMHGSGANKAGRDGVDFEVRVPVGTVIRDAETDEVLCDMLEEEQKWVACEGGRGGKGNAHFVSSTHQAPKFAQPGEEGQARTLRLELKLIADVGIIGFPNAGKSTLISRISAARPKVADYEFTTLTPNLGVVTPPGEEHGRSFVVADIPGLIEGAHRGLGLGHKFLKHIERTRAFVHLLDGSQILEDATLPTYVTREDGSVELAPNSKELGRKRAIEQLVRRYEVIRQELGLFSEKLLHKPEYLALNKLDLLNSDPELVEEARTALRARIHSARGTFPHDGEPWIVSGVSGEGIDTLLHAVAAHVREAREGRSSANPEGGAPPVRMPDDMEIRR